MLKFVSEKILKTRMNFLLFCPEKEIDPVVGISSRVCKVQADSFAIPHSECLNLISPHPKELGISVFHCLHALASPALLLKGTCKYLWIG